MPPGQQKGRGPRSSPPPTGIVDVPQGPLEDILGRLTLQQRESVARSSRAMRSAVQGMPYPFRQEYAAMRQIFRGLRGVLRVLVSVPDGGGWVLSATFDDVSRHYNARRLRIELLEITERAGYPSLFGPVEIAGGVPEGPRTHTARTVFQEDYDEQALGRPGDASGTTAMEAFLQGAQHIGSLGRPATVYVEGPGTALAAGTLVPLLERCGVPAGRVRLAERLVESRGPRIPGPGTPGRVVLRLAAPVDPFLLPDMANESNLDMDPARLPVMGPRDALLVEAEGEAHDLRLSLLRSRSAPQELWRETDPEELAYDLRDILAYAIKWTRGEGRLSVEGTGPLALWALAYAVHQATQGDSWFLAKNYR